MPVFSDWPEEGISYKDSRSLPEILEALTAYLKTGSEFARLNKPATEADLVNLENFLNIELPLQVKELYFLGNGQDTTYNKLMGHYIPLFFDGHILFSLEEIMESYKKLMGWCEKNSRFSELFDTNNNWQYKNLIPVGENVMGILLCIDMNSPIGEIIEFYFEAYNGEKIALSLKDYLGYIENSLLTRKFFVHGELLIIRSHYY